MRKILSIILLSVTALSFAQPVKKGKEPKMAPILYKGYYVGLKGDTVRGEVAVSNENPYDIYSGFYFKLGAGKVMPITSKKAKAYGFEGRHFTYIPLSDKEGVYLEYLVKGRLNFMEYKFPDTKAGEPITASAYYIQDTRPEEKDAELKELKQISEKFYKKDIKPYMKDQAMTWNDLDKFVFNKDAVVNAIKEFNKFYETAQ
jgi:hypothetical protein